MKLTRIKQLRDGKVVYKLPEPIIARLESLAGKARAQVELNIRSVIRQKAGVKGHMAIHGHYLEVADDPQG